MHSGQSLLLILDPDSLVLRNMHSGQLLLLISDLHRAGYIEHAQWAVSAPHFRYRESGSMEYAQWAASAPQFRYTDLDM